MKKERVLYLDLIRIVGFLFVTAYHFSVAVTNNNIQADVEIYSGIVHIYWAPIGVSCFFMVSGAALMHQYAEKFSWKEYYKKRFVGIYPKFWFVYVLALLFYFYREKGLPALPLTYGLLSVFGVDGYLAEFMPTFYMVGEWFLGAIIMLYILFPLYQFVMKKCKYVLPVVFLAGGLWLLYYNPFPMVIEKNLIVCSLYFVLGMLIEMLRSHVNKHAVKIGRRIAAGTGAVLILAVYLIERSGYMLRVYHVIFMVAVSLFLILMEVAEWITSERVRKAVYTISRHSYTFYLIHHVFLLQYIAHFEGAALGRRDTLILFGSTVLYVYLLAVCIDWVYAKLMTGLAKYGIL